MNYIKRPDWLEVKPLRVISNSLPPSLADVERHLPEGHPYRSNRYITWCHEATHGVNSRIRNQRRDDPSNNAFYVLDNRAIQLPEPHQIHLSHVAVAVPQQLRGSTYELYLVEQQRHWNTCPLYIHDEWSAYLNGLTTAIELNGKDAEYSDVLQPLEFMGYACCLFGLCIKNNYTAINQLRDFTAYQVARTLMLYNLARQIPRIVSLQQENYLTEFFKHFTEDGKVWFGSSWWSQIVENKDYYGVF